MCVFNVVLREITSTISELGLWKVLTLGKKLKDLFATLQQNGTFLQATLFHLSVSVSVIVCPVCCTVCVV